MGRFIEGEIQRGEIHRGGDVEKCLSSMVWDPRRPSREMGCRPIKAPADAAAGFEFEVAADGWSGAKMAAATPGIGPYRESSIESVGLRSWDRDEDEGDPTI